MHPAQLEQLAGHIVDLAQYDVRAAAPVSRRKPRQRNPFALTVRIDLVGAKPPIWRRVQIPSTLRLDQVHDLAQALFGWTDSHLHRFALGDSVWSHDSELFLCPLDIDEGEDEGIPTSKVRLDETLAEPGDLLLYVYDYGDEWALRFELEAVAPGALTAPIVVDGRGSAPPEDSGGIHSWNDKGAPAWDLEAVRAAVHDAGVLWALPAPVAEVLRRLDNYPMHADLVAQVANADLGTDVVLDEQQAAEVVRHYAWLLDRVGEGLSLTQAGYLPPRDVLAAMTELGLDARWIGKGNREDMTMPVRELRRSATRLGLLRVNKGRLLPTKAGMAVRSDPVKLAQLVAQKCGALARQPFERELTTLLLLRVAAGRTVDDEPARTNVVAALGALGWGGAQGPIEPWGLFWHAEDTRAVLAAIGCLERRGAPSPGARAVARIALQSLA